MSIKKCRQEFEKIFKKYPDKTQALLPCLYVAQEKCGCLTEEIVSFLAQRLDLPKVEVYSVITFYSMFSFEKKGKFVIRICMSLPCYLRGSREILEAVVEEALCIKPNQSTEAKKFTIEPVSCLGLCDIAPAMMINKKIYGNLTPQKAREIIRRYKQEKDK